MLNFRAHESSWLCARGSGCHEQYFGSACHWEHFHMLIGINNSCSVICLVFFPSPFLTGGQSGRETMFPRREGQAICIAFSMEGLEGLPRSCWRREDDWGGLGGNASLCFRESYGPCAGSWGAAGSWSVCTGSALCCWAFLSRLTFHSNCFKSGALWFFWTLSSLNKLSLGSRPRRTWGLFLFRLMSVLPSSSEEFSKPLICTLPGDQSDEWYYILGFLNRSTAFGY